MDDKKWKAINKPPACSLPPWYSLIPFDKRFEILRQIKQECIDIYGQSYDECPKRAVCIGKECIGRPLPWKSPTAKPYLDELAKTQNIAQGELFISGCDTCPIKATCDSPCGQINDFMHRNKIEEPYLMYKENLEYSSEEYTEGAEIISLFPNSNLELPWDCLSKRKQDMVQQYFFKGNDFKYVADKFGLLNEDKAKYTIYYALTKLSKFATMRKFIEENENNLNKKQLKILNKVFIQNMQLTDAAKSLKMSEDAVWAVINRVIKKYGIIWPTFVKKVNGKPIYTNLDRIR